MGGDPIDTQDLHVLLVESRGDLKRLSEMVEHHLVYDDAIHADHERRLRTNERFRWMTVGAVGLVTSVFTSIAVFFNR